MNTRILNRIVLLIVGLLLLSACGQLQGVAAAPCSLLTTQEVTKTLGSTVTLAQPQTDNPKYTICMYYDPRQTMSELNPMVILQFNTETFSAAAVKQSFVKANLSIDPVEGLGDTAFYASSSRAQDGTLFIVKDDHTISLAIIHSPQDPTATRQTQLALAQLALSRYH